MSEATLPAGSAVHGIPIRYATRRVTTQDGLTVAYRDYGPAGGGGIPVLCLPGLVRNAHDFHRLAAGLATTRRVLCPDYRGRGRSGRDPGLFGYAPAGYLNDLRHLLCAAGVHRLVAIGTSMGGLLAMALATAMPTMLAGLVMNDVGPEIDRTGLARILDYIGRDRPHADWPDAVADLKEMMPELALSKEAEWREVAEGTWRRGADGLLHVDWDPRIAQKLTGDVPDLWPLFRAARRVPTLVVRGSRSTILSPAGLARMEREHPSLRHVTVEGAGHAPTLNEPVAVEAIEALLAAAR